MDVPQTLGKYEIRGTLGRGAMGVVYDGWDPLIARRVAIKTVPLPTSPDPETAEEIARFRREAQAAGRLTHPNIVAVYDYGETSELAYIVMEYVDGPTLKQRLDMKERFTADSIGRVMGDVLAGLQFSHDRGVVHRDIKPGNIMLTSDGQAKIADFGIARIEMSSMTQAGTMLGTPAYMSPEQFRGEPADARTDVYSAGVLLYQLLTGERPFEGGLTTIMHKVLNTDPPAPSDLSGTVSPALDAVVRTAMAKRPQERFASAAAFAEALRAALAAPARLPPAAAEDEEGEATLVRSVRPAATARSAMSTPPKPPAADAVTPARSRLPLFGGVGLAVVLVLAGAGWFFTRPAAPPPEQQTARATPTPQPPSQPIETQPAPAQQAVPPVASPPPDVTTTAETVPTSPTVTQAPSPPAPKVQPAAPVQVQPAVPPATVEVQPAAPARVQPTAPPATVEVQPAAPVQVQPAALPATVEVQPEPPVVAPPPAPVAVAAPPPTVAKLAAAIPVVAQPKVTLPDTTPPVVAPSVAARPATAQPATVQPATALPVVTETPVVPSTAPTLPPARLPMPPLPTQATGNATPAPAAPVQVSATPAAPSATVAPLVPTPQVPVAPPLPAPAVATPAPANVQTASVTPVAMLAQITQALHGARCALATASQQDSGALSVQGVSDAASEAVLHHQIDTIPGAPPVIWQVTTVDPVFCPTLSLLRPISALAGAAVRAPGLTLAANRLVLQDGEPILPRITMPDFAGELRVDYLAHDGSLAHLYPTLADPAAKLTAQPSRHLAAGERLALGDPGPGKPQWQSGEPYGTDMIIAVAYSAPLKVAAPHNAEDKGDGYLADLGHAIELARAAGTRVSGALLLVQAVPKAK